MNVIGWMYDLAREQSAAEDVLRETLRRSQAAGYNLVGLYLEHRFEYASAPWAADAGCLTAEAAKALCTEAKGLGLRLVPFLNTLGHMEGFIRAEGGMWLAENPARPFSLQICPSRDECVQFVRNLVSDALAAFDDEWVHLGGDEAWQLGECPRCAERVEEYGEGRLYGHFYGELCRWVLDQGRRPCLWGDMLLQHPEVLNMIPRQTVIFDWHYNSRPLASTRLFRDRGFDVVCCPALRTFDSGWCFLDETREVIDGHSEDAAAAGAAGVLITTWEQAYFTQYETIWPLVFAAGRRLARGEGWHEALTAEGGAGYAAAAEIVGSAIPQASAFLAPGTWRKLRDRFVVRQNPFLLWRDWRDEAPGPAGDEILRLCDEAERALSEDAPLRFAVELHRVAVEWVRLVEAAYTHYAAGDSAACIEKLARGHALLERLRPGLMHAVAAGGSRADLNRLDLLHGKLNAVINRVQALPRGAAYRPAFEIIIHDRYVSAEQAAWLTGDPQL